MQLSDRFLNLVQQQLSSFEADAEIEYLVVYVAQTKDGQSPSLEAIGQWPSLEKALPSVQSEPELRTPSPDRRWYPLQDGSILLGALRAERFHSNHEWSDPLDRRLKATAAALAQCLGLELDRTRLLQELSHQREQVGLMVHQLRNPLAALRTYAQLLLRRVGPESKHRNLLEGLLTEQAQLNRYISALDQLGQSELSFREESSSPLLLPPVLSKASSIFLRPLLDPLIERASATAIFQGREWNAPSNWPAWTEQERPSGDGVIAEIVANLLENAFRYSPLSSPIGLHFNSKGLCVWDGGLSIAVEEREMIFRKGFRGKTSNKSTGSGLGLALARQLAEQIDASLELISSPANFDLALPDTGNAFVLTLPVIKSPTQIT